MIGRLDMQEAKDSIAQQFVEHCQNGEQTRSLNDGELAACGQFIDEQARSNTQRGIHGTAAALRVLGLCHEKELCKRMINFVLLRRDIETAKNQADTQRISDDESNVIKLSELLFGVAIQPASLNGCSDLKAELVSKLQAGCIEEKGWAYFLGENTLSPLATAYSVLALSAAGEDVSKAINYLKEAVNRATPDSAHADLTINIACLYAIVFHSRADDHNYENVKRLKLRFDQHWKALEGVMQSGGVEQNIEYWKDDKTFYVRVPWQLYLLALAAELKYYRRFLTQTAQARLGEVVETAKERKFIYPHSGFMVSARTNAIAFEILSHIQRLNKNRLLERPLLILDAVRNSALARILTGIVALGVCICSVWQWYASKDRALSDLAPEFVAPVLVYFALWTKRK